MTIKKLHVAAFAIFTTIGMTVASADPLQRDRDRGPRDGQRDRGPGRGGPPRGDQHLPPLPVLKALDENHDGVIDSGEIENATQSLLSLDRNSDGKLTREELLPDFGAMRRGGQGRPGGGDRGPRPGEDGAQRRGNPAQMFARMDKDGDGSLTKDEVPEQMRDKFEKVDADADGTISQQELVSAIERRMKQGGKGNMRGGNRDAAEGGEKPRRPPLKDKDRKNV